MLRILSSSGLGDARRLGAAALLDDFRPLERVGHPRPAGGIVGARARRRAARRRRRAEPQRGGRHDRRRQLRVGAADIDFTFGLECIIAGLEAQAARR